MPDFLSSSRTCHPPSREYTETHLDELFADEEAGYHRGLKNRQIQMIAIGGAIGTGLFMGAGGRLHRAGPSLSVIYAICGSFEFLVLRAMGELVLHFFVVFGTPIDGQQVGFSLIGDHGGLILNGLMPAIVIVQGVVFAYAGIELIGTTAGETQEPRKIIPKASGEWMRS